MRNDPWVLITLCLAAFVAILTFIHSGDWVVATVMFPTSLGVFAWIFIRDEEVPNG